MPEVASVIRSILDKGYLMSLATQDKSGLWVADVIYVHDLAMNIYWLSRVDTRHSLALLKNPSIAATITVNNSPLEDEMGIQIMGTAEKVEGEMFEVALKHRKKRKKPAPKAHEGFLDAGESWYKLTPKKIDVIHVPYFGWKKEEMIF